jgi:hypothetical protein
MTSAHVEYMGFKSLESTREYSLRVRHGASEAQDFTIVISNTAFLSKLVRYQDGPDLCFHKLQRALAGTAEDAATPAASPVRLSVTDEDLDDYRALHAPKAPNRRAKPQPPPEA